MTHGQTLQQQAPPGTGESARRPHQSPKPVRSLNQERNLFIVQTRRRLFYCWRVRSRKRLWDAIAVLCLCNFLRRADAERLELDPYLVLIANLDFQRVHVAGAGRGRVGPFAGQVETGRVAGAEVLAARGVVIDRAAGVRTDHLQRRDAAAGCDGETRPRSVRRESGSRRRCDRR